MSINLTILLSINKMRYTAVIIQMKVTIGRFDLIGDLYNKIEIY